MPLYDQPMRKLLGTLEPTISWLSERGPVEAGQIPPSHVDAIKQLERIGIVCKRNNRCYELQKIRLKKMMGSLGIDELVPYVAAPAPPSRKQLASMPVSSEQAGALLPIVAPVPQALGTQTLTASERSVSGDLN